VGGAFIGGFGFPKQRGGGSAYEPPEAPGSPILGFKELLGDLANIIPGLAHIANQAIVQPLISLAPGGLEPGEALQEGGETLLQFGQGMTKSILSTALLPLSPLESALGSDDFKELLEFLPEEIRPTSPGERYLEGRGILPAMFEDIGNIALVSGGVAAAGKAAGLAEGSGLMRAAQAGRSPYRSAGRLAEGKLRTVGPESRLSGVASPILKGLDEHRLKQFNKEQARQAQASARETRAIIEKEGLDGMNFLRERLGDRLGVKQIEDLFQEEVHYRATIDDVFNVPEQMNPEQLEYRLSQIADRHRRGVWTDKEYIEEFNRLTGQNISEVPRYQQKGREAEVANTGEVSLPMRDPANTTPEAMRLVEINQQLPALNFRYSRTQDPAIGAQIDQLMKEREAAAAAANKAAAAARKPEVIGLQGFVPEGHRQTLQSLDPDIRRFVEDEVIPDPRFQKEVLRLRALKEQLNTKKVNRLATESPLGLFGIEPGKPGTYVTAKKRELIKMGRGMRAQYQARAARVEGVLGERKILVEQSAERHQAADVWEAKAAELENILPGQMVTMADGTVKKVYRVNPLDPEVPYRPAQRADEFADVDFEYEQVSPEALLTRKQDLRLGRYEVREEQFSKQLADSQAELDSLKAIGEDNLTDEQVVRIDELEDSVKELGDKIKRVQNSRNKLITQVEEGKVKPGETDVRRAAVREAVNKERAAAKLRAAKQMVDTMRRRAVQERAAATNLRAAAEGPAENFAQFRVAERLQRQAERLMEQASRGQEFVDPKMVPDEWYDIARGQKELYNNLKAMSGLNGQALTGAEIRAFMAENQLTWPALVRRAAERDFTPVHMRQFSKDHAERFARETFRLSPMKLQAAGTRKNRRGLIPPKDVERGFRAWVAEAGEVAWEVHSNNIIDYLTENRFISAIDPAAILSGTHIPYRLSTKELGHPEFSAFLQGTDIDPSATQYMITKGAAEALRAMNRSYDNPVTRTVAKITDPWRTATLTYSPRWYVYNTIGNMILTSAEIGPKNAVVGWYKQWRKLKKDIGGFQNIFTPEFARRDVTADFQRIGLPAEVPGPSELEQGFFTRTLREARREGAESAQYRTGAARMYNKPFVRTLNERMQRVNEIVDELARESVKQFYVDKKGLSPEAATQRAIKALVNYSDLSPFERTIVRTVFPFYAWQKGMLKNGTRLAIDHPARVQLTILVGRINRDLWDEEKETLPEYYQGLVGLPGGSYLNTRGMNPFTDAPALLTPQGIASALNPFLEIARKWTFRDQGTPFGPKEEGPFGYAQGRPDIATELLKLVGSSAAGGVLKGVTDPRPDQPLLTPGSAFGIRRYSGEEFAGLQQRQAQQEQQVAEGLPLPPRQRQGGLLAGFGFGGASRRRFPSRLADTLGAPLLPGPIANRYR
jgi:hypothetical protein